MKSVIIYSCSRLALLQGNLALQASAHAQADVVASMPKKRVSEKTYDDSMTCLIRGPDSIIGMQWKKQTNKFSTKKTDLFQANP